MAAIPGQVPTKAKFGRDRPNTVNPGQSLAQVGPTLVDYAKRCPNPAETRPKSGQLGPPPLVEGCMSEGQLSVVCIRSYGPAHASTRGEEQAPAGGRKRRGQVQVDLSATCRKRRLPTRANLAMEASLESPGKAEIMKLPETRGRGTRQEFPKVAIMASSTMAAKLTTRCPKDVERLLWEPSFGKSLT